MRAFLPDIYHTVLAINEWTFRYVFVYMSLYNAHLVLEMYRCNVLFIDLHNAWVNQSCCYVYLFFVLLFVSSFFYLIASLVNPGHVPKNLNPSQERSIPEHQKRKVNTYTCILCCCYDDIWF